MGGRGIRFPSHFSFQLFFTVIPPFSSILDSSTPEGNCSHGDVRLMNGSHPLEGRVEVCINNAWGTVCTAEATISIDDANVICRQISQLPKG